MLVKDVPEEAQFLNDSQDVDAIYEYLYGEGYTTEDFDTDEYDSFFVIVGDGDYTAIYGMHGIVPWLEKSVDILLGD